MYYVVKTIENNWLVDLRTLSREGKCLIILEATL